MAADKGHYGVLQLLLQVARNSGIIGKQNKVQVFKFSLGRRGSGSGSVVD